MNGRSENQIKNQYNGIIRNLKRFNVQECSEKSLLKTIIENPDLKLSLTITKFMSDFLVKQLAKQRIDTPLINTLGELQNLKKNKIDPILINIQANANYLTQIEQQRTLEEFWSKYIMVQINTQSHQINSNFSIQKNQLQQMYLGNQQYQSNFPNIYQNYAPFNQIYPNFQQFSINLVLQQQSMYPVYF